MLQAWRIVPLARVRAGPTRPPSAELARDASARSVSPVSDHDRAATFEALHALHRGTLLDERAFSRALELSCASPGVQRWRRFLDWLLLGLGVSLLLVGVVLLVAFNWAELPALVKLSLVASLMAGSAATAWRFELSSLVGRLALTAAAVLIGPLLAIYGQTYQTGADPYQLFLAWAALAALWVAISRFPPLLLVELVLVEVTLQLFWEEAGDAEDSTRMLGAAALQLAAWLPLELGASRGVDWLQPRWLPRLLAVAALVTLTATSLRLWLLEGSSHEPSEVIGLLVLIGLIVVMLWYFTTTQRDLFMVAAALGTAMTAGTIFIGARLLSHRVDVGEVLVLLVLIIGEVGAAAWWLRSLHAHWRVAR